MVPQRDDELADASGRLLTIERGPAGPVWVVELTSGEVVRIFLPGLPDPQPPLPAPLPLPAAEPAPAVPPLPQAVLWPPPLERKADPPPGPPPGGCACERESAPPG